MKAISLISSLFFILFVTLPAFGQIQFETHIISNDADGAQSVFAIDIDGDEDIDVLSASENDGKIAWYENDGNESFTAHTIITDAGWGYSVFALDVDGDEDIDVISASGDRIAWYENDGNENFTTHRITTFADGALSVFALDVDGDEDIDVLSASWFDAKIAWYENDGEENFTAHTISTNADGAYSVFAIDVDGDEDIDVLSASYWDDKIAWYENDGNENFTEHTITISADGAISVFALDVDGDEDVDVLSASNNDDKIVWYENDGNENFTAHTITTDTNGAQSVFALDIGGDDDIDVLSASSGDVNIAWYENDGNENFISHTITTDANGAQSVFAIDVDGDEDIDVLSASADDDKIAWYENLGVPIVPNLSVSLTPVNPPIVIPAGGGSFQFDLMIQNNDTIGYTYDGWTDVFAPHDTLISPVALRPGLILPPGDSLSWNGLTQYVPAHAPAGEYTYYAKTGIFPDSVIASDSFTFEKLAGDGSPAHDLGWSVYGWDVSDPNAQENHHSAFITQYSVSPNPFNPQTTLTFTILQKERISLKIYDIQGREIVSLYDDVFEAGEHSAIFDGTNLSSGIYFARLEAGKFSQTQKLLLIK